MRLEDISQDFDFDIFGKSMKIECSFCSVIFDYEKKFVKSRVKKGQKSAYCSRSCFNKSKTKRDSNCRSCGNALKRGQYSFCGKSCAASHNNRSRKRSSPKSIESECLSCKRQIHSRIHRKYCDLKCMGEHIKKRVIDAWKSGEDPGYTGKTAQLKVSIRAYIFETRGTACAECGWDKRHPDGSILTEIDHKDGNAKNCSEDNLRVLCPNCHAMTVTFRARNRVSARKR